MQVTVSGKNMDVGSALKEHLEERLEKGVSKYFDRAIDAEVVVTKVAHLFQVTIHVNEGTGTGVLIRSRGESEDVYAACDVAADKIEKQLRRYKKKLQNHHNKRFSELNPSEMKALEVKKYVIEPEKDEANDDEGAPIIVAEKPAKLESLTVNEAVMLMDLAELPAMMFIDRKSGDVSVVYHRHDGHVSWVNSGVKVA